jgi:hypothetical protein
MFAHKHVNLSACKLWVLLWMSKAETTSIRIQRDTLERLNQRKDKETHDELVNRLLDELDGSGASP